MSGPTADMTAIGTTPRATTPTGVLTTGDGNAAMLVPRPRLRGWLHAITAPIAVIGGAALVVLAPSIRARTGMAVFALTAALLFGTSALYHRGRWSPRAERALQRLDHSNIFLIIAGTYTAFALALLPAGQAATLLMIMWGAAAVGVAFKVAWLSAPRWVSTPIYVLLGWVAVFYINPLYQSGGALVLALIVAGGLLYTVGALVFGLRRPDPSPRWFGFHEVFHACTVAAFTTHLLAAGLVISV